MWLLWVGVSLVGLVIVFDWLRVRRIPPENKAVLVTGAASGIGLATARELLRLGCFVFATDVNEQALKEAYSAESKDRVKTIRLDVTSQEDVDEAIKIVDESGYKLYGLVNNAGIGATPDQMASRNLRFFSVAEYSVDQARMIYEVNLLGTHRMTHAFFPHIASTQGCIVNMASIAGRVALPFTGVYSATKYGLIGYTDTLRREASLLGVRVVSIEPGFTATGLSALMKDKEAKFTYSPIFSRFYDLPGIVQYRRKKTEGMQMQDPVVVAKAVSKQLFSDPAVSHQVVDGIVGRVLWWTMRNLPTSFVDRLMMGDFRRHAIKH